MSELLWAVLGTTKHSCRLLERFDPKKSVYLRSTQAADEVNITTFEMSGLQLLF